MPRAHGDCNFRDEWLVQDRVGGERCRSEISAMQVCMNIEIFHARNANSRLNSLFLDWRI